MINRNQLLPGITVKKVVFNGLGLAHYHGHNIFVFQGLPGDNVDAVAVHKRGDTFFAEIKKYNSHSKLYKPPPCPHFHHCGGCDWLNVDYQDQLSLKQQIVEEVYNDLIPETIDPAPIISSPNRDRYRNKIILPVTTEGKSIKAGMYARRSHKVIPHSSCFLQSETSERIIAMTCELLTKGGITVYNESTRKGNLRFIGIRHSAAHDEHLLMIVTKNRKLPFSRILCDKLTEAFPGLIGIVQDINSPASNRNISSEAKILFGRDYIKESLNKTELNINYSAFFQINTGQCLNILQDISRHLETKDRVIDAYSGIGTIGIAIADNVKQVVCLEQHQEAVKNGIANIKANNLDNCSYIAGKVEKNLEGVTAAGQFNTLIVDPPRKGLDSSVISVAANSAITKIVYLSCNLTTQKRDILMLTAKGFTLEYLQAYDMFPHTHHIESLAVLKRR